MTSFPTKMFCFPKSFKPELWSVFQGSPQLHTSMFYSHLKISLTQLKSCKLFKNLPGSESAILKYFLIVLCCEREHATCVSVSNVFPATKTSIFHLVICKSPELAMSLFLREFLHQHMAMLRMIALAFSLLI